MAAETNSSPEAAPRVEGAKPKSISTVRAEFAVTVAVVTFLVGFLFGRLSDGLSLARGSRALAVEPVTTPGGESEEEWIARLVRETEESPGSADAWTRLGNAYFDVNRSELAIGAYEKSLAIAPGDPNVITDLGIMYRESGNPSRAVELFAEAAIIDPNHIRSRFNRGIVLLHDLRDSTGAAEAWREVIALDPTFRSPGGQLVTEMVRALATGQE